MLFSIGCALGETSTPARRLYPFRHASSGRGHQSCQVAHPFVFLSTKRLWHGRCGIRRKRRFAPKSICLSERNANGSFFHTPFVEAPPPRPTAPATTCANGCGRKQERAAPLVARGH